jgi:hypothetical protein
MGLSLKVIKEPASFAANPDNYKLLAMFCTSQF